MRQPALDLRPDSAMLPINPRRARGKRNYHAGLAAEDCVARTYRKLGYALAEARWRGQAGEIDLIFRDGDTVIFVEVKRAADFARAAEMVGTAQSARIVDAAWEYLGGQPLGLMTPARIDVALVDATGRVEILENAIGH